MFKSWGIARRVGAGFAAVLAVVVLLAATSYFTTTTLSSVFERYKGDSQRTVAIARFVEDFYDAYIKVTLSAQDGDTERLNSAIADVEEVIADTSKQLPFFAETPDLARTVAGLEAEAERFITLIREMSELTTARGEAIATARMFGPELAREIEQALATAETADDREGMHAYTMALDQLLNGRIFMERYLDTTDLADFANVATHLDEAAKWIASASTYGARAAADQTIIERIEGYKTASAAASDAIEAQEALLLQRVGPLADTVLNAYKDMLDVTVDAQADAADEAAATILSSTIQAMAISAAGLALGVALAWFVGRSISRAVGGMADQMRRVAEGDFDLEPAGAEHKSELGAMARALTIFRDNGLRVRRLDEEKARERQAMMTSLQQAFGKVVDGAVEGDFSRRVTDRFPDPELNALGEGLNRLVKTVEDGLGETGRVMADVARGDLSSRMSGVWSGAFAQLQSDVNQTVERLAGLVSEITAVSADIESGVNEIASAAREVSQRAEQQAASLEETSATMEEMSSSVKQNADNAAQADRLARDAASRAAEGGQLAGEAAAAMAEIEASSKRITEIVSLIDSIAFTTNLLALNASVEAARAGEAGKGFAVVASEVRTLAQRSADAARDIRNLIEESASHVVSGVERVDRTRDALKGIITAIESVGATVGEITAAGREQASGVSEISSAISQMDQITQANAALAEEAASNAAALSEQAEILRRHLGAFSIAEKRRRAA